MGDGAAPDPARDRQSPSGHHLSWESLPGPSGLQTAHTPRQVFSSTRLGLGCATNAGARKLCCWCAGSWCGGQGGQHGGAAGLCPGGHRLQDGAGTSWSDGGTDLKSVSEVQRLLTAKQVQMPRGAPTPDWEAAGSLPGAGGQAHSQPPGSNCLRMQSGWDIFHSARHLHTALPHTGMCLRVHKHRRFHEQKRFPELRAECVSLGVRVAICTRAGTAARTPALPCPALPAPGWHCPGHRSIHGPSWEGALNPPGACPCAVPSGLRDVSEARDVCRPPGAGEQPPEDAWCREASVGQGQVNKGFINWSACG